MFENNTEEAIKDRMLSRVNSGVYKGEGGFVGDAISPVATELEQAYIDMNSFLEMAFAATTDLEHLEMKAEEIGLFKGMGLKSLGTVKFLGADGTLIPIGSEVNTVGGLYFLTKEDATIVNGVVEVPTEAQEVGTQYNILPNTITQLSSQILGVTSVVNEAGFTGGEEVETKESLLQRYLFKCQNPASSGNIADYTGWAKSVAGVGDVRVLPTWNGGGTVKLILINKDKNYCGTSTIKKVVAYIETKRPVGAVVTVVSAQLSIINVSVSITVDETQGLSLQDVKSKITKNIYLYLQNIAFVQNFISYAKVGNIIMQTQGVSDYVNLTVNGATTNVAILDTDVAVLGGVTYV